MDAFAFINTIFADALYQGLRAAEAARSGQRRIEIVKRSDTAKEHSHIGQAQTTFGGPAVFSTVR